MERLDFCGETAQYVALHFLLSHSGTVFLHFHLLLCPQNAEIGVVAPVLTGFAANTYNLTIQACGVEGGCSIMPLVIIIKDTLVLEPRAASTCYMGLVRSHR